MDLRSIVSIFLVLFVNEDRFSPYQVVITLAKHSCHAKQVFDEQPYLNFMVMVMGMA